MLVKAGTLLASTTVAVAGSVVCLKRAEPHANGARTAPAQEESTIQESTGPVPTLEAARLQKRLAGQASTVKKSVFKFEDEVLLELIRQSTH
ncbi:MAG: hypothetical protein RIR70_159 [Pseudomonadota bacterium]|jgi:hypothetical protein